MEITSCLSRRYQTVLHFNYQIPTLVGRVDLPVEVLIYKVLNYQSTDLYKIYYQKPSLDSCLHFYLT